MTIAMGGWIRCQSVRTWAADTHLVLVAGLAVVFYSFFFYTTFNKEEE